MVRIVLDTGVFFHPAILRRLPEREEDVVVPAVAMAERVRQLLRDGRNVQAFHDQLSAGDFTPEALQPEAACAIVQGLADDSKWDRLARDAFVAAHLRPGDELWTTNPKDFRDLGVPVHAIVAVP